MSHTGHLNGMSGSVPASVTEDIGFSVMKLL